MDSVLNGGFALGFVIDDDIQITVVPCVGGTREVPGDTVSLRDGYRLGGIEDGLSGCTGDQ